MLQDLMDSQLIKGINIHTRIQAWGSNTGIQADVFLLSPPVVWSPTFQKKNKKNNETSGCSGFLDVWLCLAASQILWLSTTVLSAGQPACSQCVRVRAWKTQSSCPQFNVRRSTRAAVTQQRGLASQNSSAKEAQAARIVQTFCNFRSPSRRLKRQLKATLRTRLAALIFCALEMMKGGFDPLPSGEEHGGGNQRGGFPSVATCFVGGSFLGFFGGFFLTIQPRLRQWMQQIPCRLWPPTIDAVFTNLVMPGWNEPRVNGTFSLFMSLFFLIQYIPFLPPLTVDPLSWCHISPDYHAFFSQITHLPKKIPLCFFLFLFCFDIGTLKIKLFGINPAPETKVRVVFVFFLANKYLLSISWIVLDYLLSKPLRLLLLRLLLG